jgi:glutaredoxin
VAIKLYRCPSIFVKISAHPCWNVQKALDEQGIEYEVVKGPVRRGKRDELERLSGQRIYPVIQFEDGSIYREESKDMVARIRDGKLFSGREPAGQAAETSGASEASPQAPPA